MGKICKLQYNGITVDGADSRVKPCCHFDPDETIPLKDISEVESFDEQVKSKLWKKIRNKTAESQIPQCSVCWDKEAGGQFSRREEYKKLLSGRPKHVENLQLALDYTCNMMCRICAPKHSSKWNSATNVLDDLFKITRQPVYKPNPVKQNYAEHIRRVLENTNLRNLRNVEFIGGEPFLSKNLEWALTHIVDRTRKNIVYLRVSTNCSIAPSEIIIDKFRHFKEVYIGLSIDAVGDLANVIRTGIDWSVIEENLYKWRDIRKTNKNVQLRLNPTISILNCNKIQPIIDIGEELKIDVTPHILRGPEWLCLEQIPLEERKKFVITYNSIHKQHRNTNNIILSNRKVENKLDMFLASTKVLDNYHNNTFSDINPEIMSLAEKYANVV